ncbi:MAG: L-threonylcarbamoyladenylate synthase [Clostridia bacterium]
METKILGVEGIELGAKLLAQGEVVAFPTETVYGLGGDAFNEAAIKKIYEAKGRPSDNPLIVHISDISQVELVARVIPDEFYALAKRFMPGPLTIILPKKDCVPFAVTGGLDTVAVRMPSHPIARELIAKSGTLIAAPSANSSMHISPTKAEHVFEDLNGKIPLIIDGGECEVGIESTVLSLATEIPTILRPGIVTEGDLTTVIDAVTLFRGKVEKAQAPGMKYKHYAPKCVAILASCPEKAVELYKKKSNEGFHAVILALNVNLEKYSGLNIILLGDSGKSTANRIYSALHEAESHYDFIIVDKLPSGGVFDSVMNRIIKATAGIEE